jgi:hypothetical protein
MGTENIIIDGWTHIDLKDKYIFEGHVVGVGIKFYCLVETAAEPWLGNFDKRFNLNGAIFYKIDEYCCTSEEDYLAHREYFYSIKCFAHNIRRFAKDTKLKAYWDSIERWAFLG